MKIKKLFALATLVGLSTWVLMAIQPKTKNVENQKPESPMTEQEGGGPYDKIWQEIDSLENLGLTQDALTKTEALYAKLDASKEPVQFIKAVAYRSKFMSRVEEDGLVKAIYRFSQELDKASYPAKPILQSMTAQMYSSYLSNNLHRYQDRTKVESEYNLEDIRSWDLDRISKKVMELYDASLDYPNLKSTKISQFEDILIKGENTQGLRPTLYDFLAHRALDYYSNEASYLTEPSYKFYIEQAEAFAIGSKFLKHSFTSKDSSSRKLRAVKLYQELEAHHANDTQPEAYMEVVASRLVFMEANSVVENKKELYLKALNELIAKYKGQKVSQEPLYLLALHFNNDNEGYQDDDTYGSVEPKSKWSRREAKNLFEEIVKLDSKSYRGKEAETALFNIVQPSIGLETEKVAAANKPFLGRLNFKNAKNAHFRIYKLNTSQLEELEARMYEDEGLALRNILKGKAANQWSLELPWEEDYRGHSAEVKFPALDFGAYIVFASYDGKFDLSNEGAAVCVVRVSNIAHLSQQNYGKQEFYVTDRLTGKPLVGVTCEFYQQVYNQLSRNYSFKLHSTVKTDAKGIAMVGDGNTSLRLKVINGKDELYMPDQFYVYGQREKSKTYYSTNFFLDRGIYRPGQTIYFKGICLEHPDGETSKSKVRSKVKSNIELLDANWQKVAEAEVVSNDFGTFQGTFTAPTSGLTGQMQIRDASTGQSIYFRVEEYKRPKFEVTFEAMKQSYRVGDKVMAKGVAKAYAGNTIDGAKVQYRVVRKASFPCWEWWKWGWYIPYNRSEMEILNGETNTNEKGEYAIEFTALPDKSIPKDQKPQFSYFVYADVTDINGETHSSERVYQVGYVALSADFDAPAQIWKDSLSRINLITQNLDGEFEPAQGDFVIEKLKDLPNNLMNRKWSRPDKFVISEADFKKDFPHMPYKDENEDGKRPVEKKILEGTFNTANFKHITLDKSKFTSGTYKITMKAKDKFGEGITVIKFMRVNDKAANKVVDNRLFAQFDKTSYQPGELAKLYIGSSLPNATVLVTVEEKGGIVAKEVYSLKGIQELKFPVEEKHRGNYFVHLAMVHSEQHFVSAQTVEVPWSNKDLKIEFSTFRDKLYPGQEEEWRLKISGPKGDKVAAELLAAMYDASLDNFASNSYGLSLYNSNYSALGYWSTSNLLSQYGQFFSFKPYIDEGYTPRGFDELNWFGFEMSEGYYYYNRRGRYAQPMLDDASVSYSMAPPPSAAWEGGAPKGALKERGEMKTLSLNAVSNTVSGEEKDTVAKPDSGGNSESGKGVPIRTNLKETVFFFPQLMTDADGSVIVKFKMNEALTKWKFLGLAHTQNLEFATFEKMVITQKDLMVVPNAPRFMREGDDMEYSAKVSNLSEKDLSGEARLELFDAITMKPIDANFGNSNNKVTFMVKAGQSAPLTWKIKVPNGFHSAITHRVVAKAGNFSDGEESALPVVTNKMLVTESMPLPIRGLKERLFNFTRMAETMKSNTLEPHKYTLEFTSNPAWYGVQSLPYLMEYPYECTEQVFSRFYANSLATTVANSHPRIKAVFDNWKNFDPNALKSNLEKNQELKYALLEETPWVLASQNEEKMKQNVGLLFDLNRMSNEMESAIKKIQERQLANGGFTWFPGNRDDHYITQYLVEGFGHLDRLGVSIFSRPGVSDMVSKAVLYCDDRMVEWYKKSIDAKNKDKDNLYHLLIHYLYARSYYLDGRLKVEMSTAAKEVYNYALGQADKYWNSGKGNYMQGMIALAAHRSGKRDLASKIVNALRQNALQNDELGMYWKYPSGYYWFELPIESQALMVEVFDEVANDAKAVEEIKIWLVKSRQTNHWPSTKATAAACYALLLKGDNWLLEDKEVEIKIGGKVLDQSQIKKEAGTGYFKKSWDKPEIKAEMSQINVKNPNKNPAWGAIYWQYFEQLDKITTFQETPLKINKKLFKQVNTDRGPELRPLSNGAKLNVGDLVKVRVEITVDRPMEYVHLKDMRASGFEPVNVLSQSKYQDGLYYYESTKDLATNFFMGYLPKGTYVFEYPLRVSHKGNFSNGITTMQCMYAPEFTSHSEGIRVIVE